MRDGPATHRQQRELHRVRRQKHWGCQNTSGRLGKSKVYFFRILITFSAETILKNAHV